MFQWLGEFVAHRWQYLLASWFLLAVGLHFAAPAWESVVEDGEFVYLPEDAPSRNGEEYLRKAFPNDLFSSSAIIVVRRASRREGLISKENAPETPAGMPSRTDFDFIEEILKPRLEEIAATPVSDPAHSADSDAPQQSGIVGIRTPSTRGFQDLLLSKDNHAALVMIEMSHEFLDARNIPTVTKIEKLLDELKRTQQVPPGLELALTGPATVGRDMLVASLETADSTEFWTILLVVFLLLLIYRAPLLALIPLCSVVLATEISLNLLSLLASAKVLVVPNGIEIYIVVIIYGVGVNYCLFLIARYKEILKKGATTEEAISEAIQKVGAAITASAGTVMCGIGMMYFAHFGKFQQAGVTITFSLAVCLCITLTLTPSLLRAAGGWAFWPQMRTESSATARGWVLPSHPVRKLFDRIRQRLNWSKLGDQLVQKPLKLWLTALACMLPFAVLGIFCFGSLSYGLLSELPSETPSVLGAKAVQEHFPAGTTGPVTILLTNHDIDFSTIEGAKSVERLTDAIRKETELGVVDVRSVSHPLGGEETLSKMNAIERKLVWTPGVAHYVSPEGTLKGHVTRLDVIFKNDPFTRDSIKQLQAFESALETLIPQATYKAIRANVYLKEEGLISTELPLTENPVYCVSNQDTCLVYAQNQVIRQKYLEKLKTGFASLEGVQAVTVLPEDEPDPVQTAPIPFLELMPKPRCLFSNLLESSEVAHKEYEVHLIGSTPSIRDLKSVTDSDQIRIDLMVLGSVFLILILLLKRVAVSAYCMVAVLFSYLVTLGVTSAIFWFLDPVGFAGLDWKVPIFLFTILIAVGEDYNIFLMTRIHEEQETGGRVEGILTALKKTGGIISSCGIIMAGAFSSLLSGSLVGMQQLGFALAFGVLLNTFVVRPILLPAWLILLNSGRMGEWSQFLGAYAQPTADTKTKPKSKTNTTAKNSP